MRHTPTGLSKKPKVVKEHDDLNHRVSDSNPQITNQCTYQ